MSILCRIAIKNVNNGMATIRFIDLEHSKSWIITISENHNVLKKLDEHGLFTTDCTVLHREYFYQDLPELNVIIKKQQKNSLMCRALLIALSLIVVIFVAIYITKQMQLLMR